ncbi:hypothetical protein Micbo1qcDRAFT_61967 [Microdochium bolleyi]|uniref:DUF7053 domain-containing protein n=1 Tax=Microdochium bolleyi TaxID=196109 RepID=A0A136J5Q3_9PEZI|nr:hypothetical protein Micbo1qcDRAFT_61967 [Microdochium bolleyi]
MSKRTTFTNISPLPPSMTREQALGFLHDHMEMIDLNPLVIERHRIDTPQHALDGEQHCTWYSITDKIEYLPGGAVKGDVSYTCAFHDMPDGLQTHCYAPMGTDIRDRWTVAGTLPGEPPQPVELGLGAPKQGLYLREDVELRCNFLMSSFVKKTLSKSHGKLVDTMVTKALRMPRTTTDANNAAASTQSSQPYAPSVSSLGSSLNGVYTPPTLGGRPSSEGKQHPQPQQWSALAQPPAYQGHVMDNPSRPRPQQQQQYPNQQPQGLGPAPHHHQAPSPVSSCGGETHYSYNVNGHYRTQSASSVPYQSPANATSPWPAPLNYNKPLPPSPVNGAGAQQYPQMPELGGIHYTTSSNGEHAAELGGDSGRSSYSQQPQRVVYEMPTEFNSDWRTTPNGQKMNGAQRPAELA